MDIKYLEFIQKYLSETPVMHPDPTPVKSSWSKEKDIRAVVIDIYGTILISESGDIEESDISARNLEESLHAANIKLLINGDSLQKMLFQMLQLFRGEIIRIHEMERSADKPFPEIDIISIWNKILGHHRDLNHIEIGNPFCIKCFTFLFENLSNTIYPMPGLKEVISRISESGIPLGIISNAQFYTPSILNFFLNDKISEEEFMPPFDPDITVYSYKYQRAKPDPFLFDIVSRKCFEKYSIKPEQILFLGNDMFRDIYPAHKAGFKTVLFAGDNRSLRLREEKPELKHITPDHIITELDQLTKILL